MSHTEKQRSNLLFTGAVSKLEADGCKLLPNDYVDLNRLACNAVNPQSCSVSLFTIPPICAGRAVIQVPTCGAWLWWERCGKEWYGNYETLGVIAFAYICHYSRDEAKIEALYDRSKADSEMLAFRMMIGCSATTAELKAGLDRMEAQLDEMFSDTESGEGAEEPVSASVYGDMVARLCSAYHNLSPHKVLYELSPDECIALLSVAPSPFGSSGVKDTSEFDALAKFQNFVRKLAKERKPCSA